MDIAAILALYDAKVRAQPGPQPGVVVERADGVVRLVGAFNLICHWSFADPAAGVAAQAEHFAARGEALLWPLYDHDEDLAPHLSAAGFALDDTATLMMLDLSAAQALADSATPDVVRVSTRQGVIDFMTAAHQAFDEDESWRVEAYAARMDDPGLSLFVAYQDGRPVASARLEVGADGVFGDLFGGGVAPDHRGRGFYRQLVAARAGEARTRGLSYLATGARDTSRPMLAHLGFEPMGSMRRWRLPATQPPGV